MIVPVIDRISRFVDQRIRVAEVKAESALYARRRSGECGRHCVLAGVER